MCMRTSLKRSLAISTRAASGMSQMILAKAELVSTTRRPESLSPSGDGKGATGNRLACVSKVSCTPT
eukprot:2922427-Alexandrium_andersonii.AAC.1